MGWSEHTHIVGDDRIVYLDIDILDDDLKDLLDQCIVDICYGDSRLYIEEAKAYILEFIEGKDERRKVGAVGEFFIHLYLKTKGFTQECLFTNLEENSPKKGFDGVYSDEQNNTWFMESKSGCEENTNHKEKIEYAYTDLKSRIESTDRSKNNPWMNAFNHVKNAGGNTSLENRLIEISRQFRSGAAQDISNYNIAPCGTIMVNTGATFNGPIIASDCYNYFITRDYAGLFGICVTNRVLEDFMRYLRNEL